MKQRIQIYSWDENVDILHDGIFKGSFYFKTNSLILFCFSSRIIEGKEKDDPKTIPLKIFAKDIGNCAYVSFSSLLFNAYETVIYFVL